MYKLDSQKYLLDMLGSFWSLMSEKDKGIILNFWEGYTQIAADYYARLYQEDYSKSLEDIQTRFFKLWQKYNIIKYFSLEEDPDTDYQGQASDLFLWDNSTHSMECNFINKSSFDARTTPLTSSIDQYTNLYWEVGAREITSGPGGLVGYFNSVSKDLTNSIAVGWSNGRAFGVIGDSDGVLTISTGASGTLVSGDNIITATYIASGGELQVEVYGDGVLVDEFSVIKAVPSFLTDYFYGGNGDLDISGGYVFPGNISTISEGVSGVTGSMWECDTFGITNINNKNHIDEFNEFVYGGSSTAFIYKLVWLDPSIASDIQYIPTLQSSLELPILTLTYGATGDFVLINNALHFFTIVPGIYFWSPKTYYDNDSVENNFGLMVNYEVNEGAHVTQEYLDGVKGMWHSYLYGPTINNIETGLSILARQPFARKEGIITDIISPYDEEYSLIEVTPTDGTPVNQYFYKTSLGIAINDDTDVPFVEGDTVHKFDILTNALAVVDTKMSDTWWQYHLLGEDHEIQKHKSFGIRLKKMGLTANSLSIMVGSFINHLKPTDTRVWFMKETDYPIFIMDNYAHTPYVDVLIIGDQNVYLPADFIYDSRSNIVYYGYQETATITYDFNIESAGSTIVSIYDIITGDTEYDHTPEGLETSGAGESSMLYLYGNLAFASKDLGLTWSKVKNLFDEADAEFDYGSKIITDSINVLSTNVTIVVGYKDSTLKAGAIVDWGGIDRAIQGEITASLDYSDDLEGARGGAVESLSTTDLLNARGTGIFIGVRDSDNNLLAVNRYIIAARQPYEIQNYNIVDTIDLARTSTSLCQEFELEESAPNGFTLNIPIASVTGPVTTNNEPLPLPEVTLQLFRGTKEEVEADNYSTVLESHVIEGIEANYRDISITFTTPLTSGTYVFRFVTSTYDFDSYYVLYQSGNDLGHLWYPEGSPIESNFGPMVEDVWEGFYGGTPRQRSNSVGMEFTPEVDLDKIIFKFKYILYNWSAYAPIGPTELDYRFDRFGVEIFGDPDRYPYPEGIVGGAPSVDVWRHLAYLDTDPNTFINVVKNAHQEEDLSWDGDPQYQPCVLTVDPVSVSGVHFEAGHRYIVSLAEGLEPSSLHSVMTLIQTNKDVVAPAQIAPIVTYNDESYPYQWIDDELYGRSLIFAFLAPGVDETGSICFSMTCPLEFKDYITYEDIGSIDLGEDLLDNLENTLEVFKTDDYLFTILAPRKDSNECYFITMNTSTNPVTYSSSIFTANPRVASISLRRFFYNNDIIYMYFKETSTGNDYITASKDGGETWATPSIISNLDNKIHSMIRPSFLKTYAGQTYILGTTTTGHIVMIRQLSVS